MRNLQDATLRDDFTLPAAASTNTVSDAIDMGALGAGERPETMEALLTIPALSTTIVPDTRTVTLSVEASDDATFATGVETLRSKVLTGASGAGTDASDLRAGIPANCPRYVRGKVAFGASTTTGAAVSAAFALVF